MSPSPVPARGRGAQSNASGRFEALGRDTFDDGWNEADLAPAPLVTTLTPEHARSIIARNDSPDVGFDRSINPYRGCEHGCIYCYARPAHAYVGLSPGLDFESKLFFKPEAARLLASGTGQARLSRWARSTSAAIPTPTSRRKSACCVTRQVLEVLERPQPPVLDHHQVGADRPRRRHSWPDGRARPGSGGDLGHHPRPQAGPGHGAEGGDARNGGWPRCKRWPQRALPVSVMFAPVIPGLNDHEMEAVLERAAAGGSGRRGLCGAAPAAEIKDLFREWLETAIPDRANRVMSLVRQMRGGHDYDPHWGKRMKGDGPIAEMLGRRFAIARRRFGLDRPSSPLDLSRFRPPGRPAISPTCSTRDRHLRRRIPGCADRDGAARQAMRGTLRCRGSLANAPRPEQPWVR